MELTEIKELFEKCGLDFYWNDDKLWVRTPSGGVMPAELLISLDNLFKYAVPRYIDKTKTGASANHVDNAYARLFEQWRKQLFFIDWENSADALFRTIQQAFKEANPETKIAT